MFHARNARNDGCQGAHHADETREHHCGRAESIKEMMGAIKSSGPHPGHRSGFENSRANLASKQEADLVACDCGEGNGEHELPHLREGVRLGCQNTRGEQQGIAGEDEADEHAGFHEDDGEDANEAESIDQHIDVEHASLTLQSTQIV